jgi:hypothetical protein
MKADQANFDDRDERNRGLLSCGRALILRCLRTDKRSLDIVPERNFDAVSVYDYSLLDHR